MPTDLPRPGVLFDALEVQRCPSATTSHAWPSEGFGVDTRALNSPRAPGKYPQIGHKTGGVRTYIPTSELSRVSWQDEGQARAGRHSLIRTWILFCENKTITIE